MREYLNTLDPVERDYLLAGCAAAREDVVWHNALVLRNEKSLDVNGEPRRISMAPCHVGLLDFIEHTRRGVVLSAPKMGKSQQVTIGYTIHQIGRDVSTRVVIASAVEDLTKPFITSIKQYILDSIELALIFPHLMVGTIWADMTIDLRSSTQKTTRKDFSIRGIGVHGRITGGRIDLYLGDDMLDQENTRTEAEADKVYHRILNAESRITPGTGKMILLANAWEEYDAAHKLIKDNKWDVYYMPAADENWDPTWEAKDDKDNEGWTREAIEIYDPIVKERHLRLRARRKEDIIFHVEWLESCKREMEPIYSFAEESSGRIYWPPGCHGVTAIDLASRLKEKADWSVFMPLLCGPPKAFGVHDNTIEGDMTWALWPDRRKLAAPDIISGILDYWHRYGFPFVVEDNGAQIYIVDLIRDIDPEIPIIPFTTTGAKKRHPEWGIRAIANEYQKRKHILACDRAGRLHPEYKALYEEMQVYDERVGVHTGDCLMAYWFGRSYLRQAFGIKRYGTIDLDAGPQLPSAATHQGPPQAARHKLAQGAQDIVAQHEKSKPTRDGLALWGQVLQGKQETTERQQSPNAFLNSLADRRRPF